MQRTNARASILLQTGGLTLEQYNNPIRGAPVPTPPSRSGDPWRPYWAAGLDGTGQVGGLALSAGRVRQRAGRGAWDGPNGG